MKPFTATLVEIPKGIKQRELRWLAWHIRQRAISECDNEHTRKHYVPDYKGEGEQPIRFSLTCKQCKRFMQERAEEWERDLYDVPNFSGDRWERAVVTGMV